MRGESFFHTCPGHSEVLHLTGLDQFLNGARDILDWYIRINAVLIEEVDGFDPESLK